MLNINNTFLEDLGSRPLTYEVCCAKSFLIPLNTSSMSLIFFLPSGFLWAISRASSLEDSLSAICDIWSASSVDRYSASAFSSLMKKHLSKSSMIQSCISSVSVAVISENYPSMLQIQLLSPISTSLHVTINYKNMISLVHARLYHWSSPQ